MSKQLRKKKKIPLSGSINEFFSTHALKCKGTQLCDEYNFYLTLCYYSVLYTLMRLVSSCVSSITTINSNIWLKNFVKKITMKETFYRFFFSIHCHLLKEQYRAFYGLNIYGN